MPAWVQVHMVGWMQAGCCVCEATPLMTPGRATGMRPYEGSVWVHLSQCRGKGALDLGGMAWGMGHNKQA